MTDREHGGVGDGFGAESCGVPVAGRTYAELVEMVLDAELAAPLGRPLDRAGALEALEARAELIERLTRRRWLAVGQARDAGASWDEIEAAARSPRRGLARYEYVTKLARQQRLGLRHPRRAAPDDIGPPDPDGSGEG